MRRTLLFSVILFISFLIFFQGKEAKITPRKANELYQKGNFLEALEYYKYLLKSDENSIEYNFRIGVCYLNTNVDKGLAVNYFKAVIDLDGVDQKVDLAITWYLLGKAQHYSYRFDEAIASFEKYLDQPTATPEDIEFAKQKIQFCYNGIELLKFPVDVTFKNLGKDINTEFPEYYPHVPTDESYLIFNSKRKDNSGVLEDGSYASNVYFAQVKNGEFKKAKLLEGNVNTKEYNEAVVGISANGEEGIFYIDNGDNLVDIFVGKIEKNGVINLEVLDQKYYSNALEIAASINAKGDVMYIASDRKGGFGGADLYKAKKLPTGLWGELQNLGSEINTPFDDVFPHISEDEKTLFFSSEGHTSMGGLDIFKAEMDASGKWTSIKNIGHPINTPMDDMNFTLSATGKYGYISTLRPGGYGDLDIYSVSFNSIEPKYTVISGKLYAVNTNQLFDDIFIEVTTTDESAIYGQYVPNKISGKYVIILPPGKYDLRVEVDGYIEVIESIEILDKTDYQTYIHQDLVLKPKDLLMKLPQITE